VSSFSHFTCLTLTISSDLSVLSLVSRKTVVIQRNLLIAVDLGQFRKELKTHFFVKD